MDKRNPEQSPNNNDSNTFGNLLYEYLKAQKMTQQELANKTGLSRKTISRMITNTDNRGRPYHTTEKALAEICLALRLGEDRAMELYNAAFPEKKIWWDCIIKRETICDANAKLAKANLPLLGNVDEE